MIVHAVPYYIVFLPPAHKSMRVIASLSVIHYFILIWKFLASVKFIANLL